MKACDLIEEGDEYRIWAFVALSRHCDLISDIVFTVIQLVLVSQCNFDTLVACQRMTYVLKMAWEARLILTSSLPHLGTPHLVR